MSPEEARALLAVARVARLASTGPHVVPICFALDGDRVYSGVDHKPKSGARLRRLRNIEADPRVALLADRYDDGDWSALWWVRADGRARILMPGEAGHARAVELLCARYPQYAARPPQAEVIAIDVERWSGWSASAEPRLITPGLAHVDLVVSSLERSLEFYGGLLEPLGWRRRREIVGERGERVVYLGIPGRLEGSLGLRERQRDGAHDRYALGVHHVSFNAASREAVDACHAWLLSVGAAIESAPRVYDYTPGYYAVFFYDPDGIKLEVLSRIPPASFPRR